MYSRARPPTTGGKTKGNNTSARSTRITGPSYRANTSAIGTPTIRQMTVLHAAVISDNRSASSDEGDEI